ncbi:MAG: tRNA (adenosine(37)-N6)-dimethylallyltransferase MiaA [Chloroflexi bacterium]|nr:tRNA (adenosine(37)-N6)-dimethylallyltransferase MiaA [Chloroflexota bacterium]
MDTTRPRSGPLVVITGPTGVGKTALSIALAGHFGGEVVSADSRQVYRYMDIGTAKPTPRQRAQAPHHLIDYVDPDEPYSVVRYRDDADAVLADLGRRGQIGWIVGGTWHYLQALVDRIEPPRVAPDPALRAALEREAAERGPAALHARLAALDPVAAAAIDPANVRRVVRAIEVTQALGEPFSAAGRRRSEPLPALRLVLTLPRPRLYELVDRRVDEMVAAGWLDEVRALLARGYDEGLPSMSSTGYREMLAALKGRMPLAEAVQRTKWSTHGYIRRQEVWLRRQGGYEWIEAGPDGYARAAALVERFLTETRRG